MSVQDQITSDIKEAMKARNVDKLAALRAVKSAIMLEATKDGSATVSDEVSDKPRIVSENDETQMQTESTQLDHQELRNPPKCADLFSIQNLLVIWMFSRNISWIISIWGFCILSDKLD